MSNVTELYPEEPIDIHFVFNEDMINIDAMTLPEWSFAIEKMGEYRAFVCKGTGETFGKVHKEHFNSLLLQWLLIDDSEKVDTPPDTLTYYKPTPNTPQEID